MRALTRSPCPESPHQRSGICLLGSGPPQPPAASWLPRLPVGSLPLPGAPWVPESRNKPPHCSARVPRPHPRLGPIPGWEGTPGAAAGGSPAPAAVRPRGGLGPRGQSQARKPNPRTHENRCMNRTRSVTRRGGNVGGVGWPGSTRWGWWGGGQ